MVDRRPDPLGTPLPRRSNETPVPLSLRDDPKVAFVLSVGEALHRYGAPAHRLEAALSRIADGLGLVARFYSTPTAILASFGETAAGRTCLLRVQPGEPDLEKVAELHDVVDRLDDGAVTPRDAAAEVAGIVARRPRYRGAPAIVASAIASGSGAVFFGGGLADVGVSLAVGLLVGVVLEVLQRAPRTAHVVEPVASGIAAAAATLACRFAPVSSVVVTLAGIITLLPGLSITTSITELSTSHLASGTARLAGALVKLVGLGFGIALGTRAASALGAAPPPPPSEPWHAVAIAAAVAVAALAFAVLLHARRRDAPLIVLSCAIAFLGARVGASWLGPELGAFVGALGLVASSNALASIVRRPPSVLIVPGLLLLVPGSVGLRSVLSLLDSAVVPAVDTAFKMLLVAVALAGGVLVGNLAVPPRSAL